jgi:adenylate cyclase
MSADEWSFAQRARRRAILFADLVESVRLFQEHPALIDAWRAYAQGVGARIAPGRGGRLVRTAGDGLLLEFETVGAAAAAAFEMHDTLAAGQRDAPPERQMWLRIGLHVDEVVADEHELWGGGVNLAARVATQAQPGQTTATLAARAELMDGVQAAVEDLGPRYLKHLAEPLRVFALRPPGAAVSKAPPGGNDLRPVVAVVPFEALPADPESDALGHAMAEDIIASLARHPGLRVLSRHSTAALVGGLLPLDRVRDELGASYLLSGRFIARAGRVRLTAELCDLKDGGVIWSGLSVGGVAALFEGQDDLVPEVVGQVAQHVLASELGRVRSLPMDSLASYSLFLGASGLLHSLEQRAFDQARPVLEHLIERHPRTAAPRALLAGWHVVRMIQGWSSDVPIDRAQALAHASAAVAQDPELPAALVAQGMTQVFSGGDFAGAKVLYERALALAPHHAEAWARLSECHSQAGQHDDALVAAHEAIRLSPLDPQRYAFESFAARAAYVAGAYDTCARHAREAIRRHALHAPAHRLLIAALWLHGEREAAARAVQNYLRLMPDARAHAGGGTQPTPFTLVLADAGVPA